MAVLTNDILLQNIRRDAAFDWLGEPGNHRFILAGVFDDVVENAPGDYTLTFRAPAARKRTMGYRFEEKDDNHGGRRVLVKTDGKRTRGSLHYSLRTMKPSTNTLVTLHFDYDPGNILGAILNSTTLQQALEDRMKLMLNNIAENIS